MNRKEEYEEASLGVERSTKQLELTKQEVDTIISERGLVLIDPLSDFGFKRLLGWSGTKRSPSTCSTPSLAKIQV